MPNDKPLLGEEEEGRLDPFIPPYKHEGLMVSDKSTEEIIAEGGKIIEQEDVESLPTGMSPVARAQVEADVKARKFQREGFEKPRIVTDYVTGELKRDPEVIEAEKKRHQEHLKEMRDQAWDQGIWAGIQENTEQRVWWGEDIEGEYSSGPFGGLNLPFGAADFAHFMKDLTWGELKKWHQNSGRTQEIHAKAQEKGYSALDDQERDHLKKQNLNRYVHGTTSEGPWTHTPQEVMRLALEQEYHEKTFAGDIAKGEAPRAYPSEDITYPKRTVDIRPTGKRKPPHAFPITGMFLEAFDAEQWGEEGERKRFEADWKERAERLPPEAWERQFSEEERKQILGLDREEQEHKEWMKKYLKQVIKQEGEFRSALDAAQILMNQNHGRRLTGPVADLQGYRFLARGNLSYDLSMMEQSVVPKILEEVLQEKWGDDYEEMVLSSKETFSAEYAEALQQARTLWFEDRATLLQAGRGLAWFDADPGRTNQTILKRFQEEFIDTGLQKTLSGIGPGRGAGLFNAADVVLPYLAATTPRYSLHISSTHAEVTSHRLIDGLMGSDVSNWLGAALKTYIEVKKGYGKEGLPLPLVGPTDPETGEPAVPPKQIQAAERMRITRINELREEMRKWAYRNFKVALDDEDIKERVFADEVDLFLSDEALATIRRATGTTEMPEKAIGEFQSLQDDYRQVRSKMLDLVEHDPTAGVEVDIEHERALFFRSITEQKIREETGSESLIAAWRGFGATDGGLQELLLPAQVARALPSTAQELKWEIDDLKRATKSYVEFKTIQSGLGSPEVVERYFHNLRKGAFLFQTYDDLMRMYGEAIDADPDDIKTMRKAGVLLGLTSMVTPGTGTDFVTPMFYPMARGIKYTRKRYGAWRKDPRFLEKVADKDIRPSEKIRTIARRDAAVAESIEQEIAFENKLDKKSHVKEHIDAAELKAEASERKAAILSEEGGIYTSPEVLPGGRLRDKGFRERWIASHKGRIKRDNPHMKFTDEELEAAAQEDLRRYETEIVDRIDNSTALGDVYELNGRLYIKGPIVVRGVSDFELPSLSTINPEQKWFHVVDDEEILKLRSSMQGEGRLVQPLRERSHYAQSIWEEIWITDPAKKGISRKELTGIEYRRRTMPHAAEEEFGELPTKFSRLPPDPSLVPKDEWDWLYDFENKFELRQSTGISERAALTSEEMSGATAWSIRDPHINPRPPRAGEARIAGETLEDLAAGRQPQRITHATEEALRQEVGAAQVRATVTRALYDDAVVGSTGDFHRVADLRSKYDEVEDAITELGKKIDEVDIQGTEEFTAWAAAEKKLRQAEAAVFRAEESVAREIPRTRVTGEALTFSERRALVGARKRRLKEAKKIERRLGEEVEKIGKPIEKKQKLHREYVAEITRLVGEKGVLRTAMIGALDNWGKLWTIPQYAGKWHTERVIMKGGKATRVTEKMPQDFLNIDFELGEELFEQKDAVLARLQKASEDAEKKVLFARTRLMTHIDKHGSAFWFSGEASQIVESWTRVAKAQAQALLKRQQAETTDRIIRKRAQQIREGASALSGLEGLTGVIDNAIAVASLEKPIGGGRLLDGKVFMSDLVDKVGEKAIDHAIDIGGPSGAILKRIRDHIERKVFKRLDRIERAPPVIVSPYELRDLQGLPGVLRNAFKESHKHKNSITAVEALRLAWKDPDLKVGWSLMWLKTTAQGIARGFDPIKAKTGEMSEGLIQVAKYVEHAHGQVRDELDGLARHIDALAKKNRWTPEKRYQMLLDSYEVYLTTNTPLRWMRARATFFNEGSESIWDQAKWQMEHDPRSKTLLALREEAEESQAIWEKAENARRSEAAKATQTKPKKITQKELDDYVTATYGERLKEIEETKGLPLRAVSRAWIPETGFEGASLGQASRMYKQTYQALQRHSSLQGFLREVESLSKQVGWGRPTHDLKSLQHAASALVHAAIQHRGNDMVVRAVGGFATPRAAKDIAFLFGGEAGRIVDWDGMVRTLNRYGLPFTEQYLKRATGVAAIGGAATEAAATSKKLIATGVERVVPPKVPSIEHVTTPLPRVEYPEAMTGGLGESAEVGGIKYRSRKGRAGHEETGMFLIDVEDLPSLPPDKLISSQFTKVQKALDEEKLIHPPMVSRNPDGTLEVLRGSHLVEILRRRGLPAGSRKNKIPVDIRVPGTAPPPAPPAPVSRMVQPPPDAGRTILMPEALAKTIDDAMPKVTKDLKRRFSAARTPAELRKLGAEFDFNRLWKTSVVTGLYVPRPKYWWNNFFGDFSQMWFEHGFTTAAGVSTQLVTQQSFQLLSQIPGSKIARSWHDEMAKTFGGYENTLGSTWNALWNPHANKVWRGERGVVRTRYGTEYTYAEIRKMMSEEGILDTMVHEELLQTFARHVPEQWTSKPFQPPGLKQAIDVAEESRYNISWLATHVQQRQRGNLFMELLRQGYRPKDAARKTIDALYDWKHGITRYEALTIGKISPFYRFWRLAFKQVGRRVMDPLIRPDKAMMDALMGRSALARTRQQIAGIESVPYLLDPEIASDWHDGQAILDHAAKYYRPSWARARGLTTSQRLDDTSMEHYRKTRGRALTHSMGIMPPATILDVTEIGASLSAGFTGWLMNLNDPKRPGIGQYRLSPDFEERWWKPTLDLMFPTFSGPLEAILQNTGVDTGGHKKGRSTRVRPSEKYFLDNWGTGTWLASGAAVGATFSSAAKGLFGPRRIPYTLAGAAIGAAIATPYASTKVEDVEGVPKADAFAVGFMRLIPFLGNELPGVMDPAYFDNPYARKMVEDGDTRAGLMIPAIRFGFQGYTGIGKQYPYNPEHTVDWRAQDVKDEVAKARKEAEPAAHPIWKGYED